MFTPSADWKGKAQLSLGIASIIVGAGAWTYTTRAQSSFGFGSMIPWNPTISGLLLPISLPLFIAGVSLCTYHIAMKKTWRARDRIESALSELEALVGQKNGTGESAVDSGPSLGPVLATKRRFSLRRGAVGFALAEAVILLMMYGGLVQEYTSNLNMQSWVRANFAPGIYLLSYNAVLALAGVLGVLILQLVPKRFGSKKFQDRV